ncbi:MAG: glycosyltransferase family 2 protein, partial [Lachnospiraceae bacterium]|nr:glycosyltransferase family 2 protein [Lachnospiraceae bacterium]
LLSTEEETDLLIADKAYGYILLTTAGLSEAEVCHVRERLFYEKEEERTGFVLEKENPLIEEALRKAAQKRGWPLQGLTLIDRKKSLFHPTYSFDRQKLISVVIPNKDHGEDLAKCIDSLKRSAEGYALEILIVENNSAKKETFELYRRLEQDERIRVLQYRDRFNFSRINNFAVKEAKGELLLLLNNDMTVLPGDLLGELLMYAERPDVGAVGAKLLYPDNTIQHAGVIIGLGGVAAHSHKDYGKEDAGYMNRLLVAQNLSAVTAACLMMRKAVYEEIDGMDPGYEVAFNDADFCMRIRKKGYRVVFTPFARLTHYESKSRGTENTPEKAERFESEVQRFKALWPGILRDGDPYYNPNLTTASEDFSIRPEAL